MIPSPEGRYLAVVGEFPQTDLRVYDLGLESWTDLGTILESGDSSVNQKRTVAKSPSILVVEFAAPK